MVIVFAFKPVFMEVPISGPQAQNHVRYLLKIRVLGSLSMGPRNLHPINQKMVNLPY